MFDVITCNNIAKSQASVGSGAVRSRDTFASDILQRVLGIIRSNIEKSQEGRGVGINKAVRYLLYYLLLITCLQGYPV